MFRWFQRIIPVSYHDFSVSKLLNFFNSFSNICKKSEGNSDWATVLFQGQQVTLRVLGFLISTPSSDSMYSLRPDGLTYLFHFLGMKGS